MPFMERNSASLLVRKYTTGVRSELPGVINDIIIALVKWQIKECGNECTARVNWFERAIANVRNE